MAGFFADITPLRTSDFRRLDCLSFLAIGGAADMVSSAFRNTILQEAATDDVRGRLQGVFTVVVAKGPRVADAVHGAAAAAVGTTFAAAGGALVLIGVAIAALLAPVFVRYKVSRPNVGEPGAVSEHAPNDDKL